MCISNLCSRRTHNLEGTVMQIRIPKGVLINGSVIDPKLWNNYEYLYVYALDYYCVGISPTPIPSWDEVALRIEQVSCKQSDNMIRFMFPEKIARFYHLQEKERGFTLSGNGGIVLMIITHRTPTDEKKDDENGD